MIIINYSKKIKIEQSEQKSLPCDILIYQIYDDKKAAGIKNNNPSHLSPS